MEYAFKLARTLILHGGVGRSITHENSGYDTDARGVEINQTPEQLHIFLTLLDEQD